MPIRIRVTDNEKTKELRENLTGGDCDQQTLISYYRKEGNLVFVFDCEEKSIVSHGDKDNDKLYRGDVVEIMLTLGVRSKYLEISVNPEGHKYVAKIENPDEGDLFVNPLDDNPIETEIIETELGYIAKIIVPLSWLSEIGWSADAANYVNFYRQDFTAEGDLRLYALSPTRSASFHKPEAFVPIEIL